MSVCVYACACVCVRVRVCVCVCVGIGVSPESVKLGFIGIGVMGLSMAGHLLDKGGGRTHRLVSVLSLYSTVFFFLQLYGL